MSAANNVHGAFLSVCIAVGPSEDWPALATTITSVNSQATDAIELVVKVAKSHLSEKVLGFHYAPHVALTLLTGPDAGIYDAYNICARSANGEYVLFLGCGDLLATSVAAVDLEGVAASTRPHALYGQVLLRGPAGAPDRAFDNRCFFGTRTRLPWRNPCHSQGLVYRRTWIADRPFRLDVGPLADLVHTHAHRVFETAVWFDKPISIFMPGGASGAISFEGLRSRLRGVKANCEGYRSPAFWRVVSVAVFTARFLLDAGRNHLHGTIASIRNAPRPN